MARNAEFSSVRSSLANSTRSVGRRLGNGLMDDLKDNHERLLSSISQQLQEQEFRTREEISALQSENALLREQLAAQERDSETELRRLQEEHSSREESLRREAERTVKSLEEKLERMTAALVTERAAKERLDEEMIAQHRKDQDELEALHAQSQEIMREFEYIKTKTLPAKDHEIDVIASQLEQVRSELFVQREQFSLQERKESALRSEIDRLQSSAARDMTSLQETIKANKRAMELQDEDMARMRKAKDDARSDARRLQTTLAETQQELEILRNRHADLQQQYARLEAVVRGRKTKS